MCAGTSNQNQKMTDKNNANLSTVLNLKSEYNLRFASFNCRSVKNSVDELKSLCVNHDVICLQEHWLLPFDLDYLNCIDSNFTSFGSFAIDVEAGVLNGRPYGGTAILFRRSLSACVNRVKCNNHRITAITIGMSINGSAFPVLLASVYMPVNDPTVQSDDEFEFVCGSLNALIEDCNVLGYILCGDFNFNIDSPRHKYICNSLTSKEAMLADEMLLAKHSFTYVSDCHSTVSWLDHVIVNRYLFSKISNFNILYGTVSSDHRPVSFVLNANVVLNNSSKMSETVVHDWMASNQDDLNNFSN